MHVVADDDSDAIVVGMGYRDNPRVEVLSTGIIGGAGVAQARNLGMMYASGEFVMFLDADDAIMPTKVEQQILELRERPECGWCCSDVFIHEPNGEMELASVRYGYHRKFGSSWIYPELAQANFIPVMSPLVRRQVLLDHGITFNDILLLEDWHFWRALSKESRVCYAPQVLATYFKQPNGRNSEKRPKVYAPDFKDPLRLNLGCGTPGTRSWHPMPEMHNLDASLGWKFEDGLGLYAEGSVSGITVSHSLMYVAMDRWPFVFAEFYRVLAPGGVLRITEDDTVHPKSTRRGGWQGSDPAVTLTTPERVIDAMDAAGFHQIKVLRATETMYLDASLCQAQHGEEPDVFFVEGVK